MSDYNSKNYILSSLKIKSLYHITHIDNLESILKYGILSRNNAEKNSITFFEIADNCVFRRRDERTHKYALLFFAYHTPMLFKVQEIYKEKIVVLEVYSEVMLQEGVKFSDGNVACRETNLYENLEDLYKLDFGIIYSKKGIYTRKWRRIRAAEVLVPEKVDKKFFRAIHIRVSFEDYVRRIMNKFGVNIGLVMKYANFF